VDPARAGQAAVDEVHAFLEDIGARGADTTLEVAAEAARLRANAAAEGMRLRTPDALVIATGHEISADVILTGDVRWPSVTALVEGDHESRPAGRRVTSRAGSAENRARGASASAGRLAGMAHGELQLPLTGGCGCGGVRFELDAPLESAVYCHCTRCQRRTGTGASASGRAAPGTFRIVRGEELLRAWEPEGGAAKVFCRRCGSALFSRSDDGGIGVRLGAFDRDPGIRPQARQYVAYAAPWEPIPDDGLPRFPESRLAG
jgi:hypothetical protein